MGRFQTCFQPAKIAEGVFIASGAIVVGDVAIAAKASVWFNAVLRGDTEKLVIAAGANIQDGAVCHADPGSPLIIGAGVTVGHGAILHGAKIGDHSLIGMGAIVMNGAQIGSNCIVGAGSLISQRKVFPDNSLILGNPARIVRAVTTEEMAMIRQTAADYVEKARAFQDC
ncbi:MAG: gamma carbonic anhydrase family protein [Chloroflexi bacterium]|nr:gamma carbonic anhydrase family protein [Chloroflexota bacterium]